MTTTRPHPRAPERNGRRTIRPDAALAGILGGVLGTVAMSLFEVAWTTTVRPPHQSRRLKHGGRGLRHPAQSEPRSHEKPLSTSELLIEKTARTAFDAHPSPRQREILGSAFHYAFGATAGALYAALAPRYPKITTARGTAYGLLVWLVADELLVPAFRIADPPWRTPLRLHLYSIGAHLAYGLGLDSTRRLVEPALSAKKAHG